MLIAVSPTKKPGKSNSSVLGMLAVVLVFQVLYLGTLLLGKAMSEGVRAVIVARIGWESDLIAAPKKCLGDEHLVRPGEWKVFPRSVGESETLIVRSATNLPEKAFWKFTPDELKRYSRFDIEQVECGIKQAPVDQLQLVEKEQEAQEEHRKQTAYLWGIAPVATIRIEK